MTLLIIAAPLQLHGPATLSGFFYQLLFPIAFSMPFPSALVHLVYTLSPSWQL